MGVFMDIPQRLGKNMTTTNVNLPRTFTLLYIWISCCWIKSTLCLYVLLRSQSPRDTDALVSYWTLVVVLMCVLILGWVSCPQEEDWGGGNLVENSYHHIKGAGTYFHSFMYVCIYLFFSISSRSVFPLGLGWGPSELRSQGHFFSCSESRQSCPQLPPPGPQREQWSFLGSCPGCTWTKHLHKHQ